MEKVTTEAIRAIRPGAEQIFAGLSPREVRSARSLCTYWNRVEGDESGLYARVVADKTDKSRIIIKKRKLGV